MIVGLAVVLLFAGRSALARGAAECVAKDIRPLHPKLAQYYKTVRNQDGIGWCHSFVAAELLSAAIDVPVSVPDLAANYFRRERVQSAWAYLKAFVGLESRQERDERFTFLAGGYVERVLETALKRGVCPESALRSDLTWYSDRADELVRAMKDLAAFKTLVESEKGYREACQLYGKSTLKQMFPNVSSREAFEAVHRARAEEISSDLYELTKKACEGSRRRLPSSLKIVTLDKLPGKVEGKALVDELDRGLATGMPVGVVVHQRVLTGIEEKKPPHALTAVSREFRNGKCQYFLRNSYGKGCGYYGGKAAQNCDGAQGGFWIDEDDLESNFITVTYVRK